MRFDFQYRYLDLYFTTATVLNWKRLLQPDKYKRIITDSLQYLVEQQSIWVYGFVIMPNHFHLIWQMRGEVNLPSIQQRMMKYVSQKIKSDLRFHHPLVLDHFKVIRKDRHYQFFKEKPLSIPLYTEEVVWQKIEYVHRNPVQPKWRLAAQPNEYFFSSAGFYVNRDRQWPFLTHFWYGDDWPEVCDL